MTGHQEGVGHHLAAATDPSTTGNSLEKESMAVLSMPNRADTAALPTRTERQARLLAAMRDARHEQESLLRQQEDLVDWARSEGVTWDEIATALGLSNSGARLAYRRRRGDRGERVTLP